MKRTAFKLAASTAIVAMTMVACTAQSEAMRRIDSSSANPAEGFRAAAAHHEQAVRSLRQGELSSALEAMENAVALSPRDAGYRLLLAEIYMKSGRFDAARSTFADVIEIDPSNVRAGLSLALMQVALGRPQAAVAQLDSLAGRAAPADVGLAYALAGHPDRAIEILEPEARGLRSSPRLRQNLALSYAIAGDWQRARAVAAQDVSPADLGARLQQWAAFARPGAAAMQIAGLLGVTPVADAGQPVRLALSPTRSEGSEAFADAGPAPVQTYAASVSEAVPAYADAAPAVAPDSDWGLPASAQADAAPVPAAEAPSYYIPEASEAPASSDQEIRFAAAAQTLNRSAPVAVRTASVSLPPAPAFRRAAPQPAGDIRRGNSAFVVQLGAFSNEGNAERAWTQAADRFALADHVPLTTTIDIGGRTLHRVSVAGFAGHGDAVRLCGAIRAQGGSCFVRTNAGDASVRWAARYAQERARRA